MSCLTSVTPPSVNSLSSNQPNASSIRHAVISHRSVSQGGSDVQLSCGGEEGMEEGEKGKGKKEEEGKADITASFFITLAV